MDSASVGVSYTVRASALDLLELKDHATRESRKRSTYHIKPSNADRLQSIWLSAIAYAAKDYT